MTSRAPKTCASCGRTMEWRRKWAANWEHVRYCSERCRRQRPNQLDRALERAILEVLDERAATASICPSEAARRADPDRWRELMPRVRSAARRLVDAGRVEIIQRGRPVDPSTARGPIRIRRTASGR